MVAPLEPPQYLELLAVERIGDPESRHLAALIDGGRSLLGWGVAVDDIEAVATRLNLEVQRGSIAGEDGSTGSWQYVYDASDESLPFFIRYDDSPEVRLRRWQDRAREVGNAGFGGLTFVEVAGDEGKVRRALGGVTLPVRFVNGRPGLHAVGIAGPTSEIVLRESQGG